MDKIYIPYGDRKLEICIPGNISVRLLEPKKFRPTENPNNEIKKALQEPLGSAPLDNMAAGKQNAAIIVSDQTRLAPTAQFLPYIIKELMNGGISKSRITIVIAVGAHRKVTESEIKKIVGDEIYQAMECISSSTKSEDCVALGKTSRGTPVHVFYKIANCKLIVATGNIEPHRMAAFSGGAKALVPGCCAYETIEKNHALSIKGNTTMDPDKNEVRADLEEAAAIAGLSFIFNVVVDHSGRLIKAYAGDPVTAHRAGCNLAESLYKVPPGPAGDIVLASAGGHPKDQNLYQVVKALQNAAAVVKPGGTVILAARSQEGFGNETFESWVESGYTGPKALERFSGGFKLGGHKAAYSAKITNKCKVHLISELPEDSARLLNFHPGINLQDTFDTVAAGIGTSRLEAVVMPYAGVTFPM